MYSTGNPIFAIDEKPMKGEQHGNGLAAIDRFGNDKAVFTFETVDVHRLVRKRSDRATFSI